MNLSIGMRATVVSVAIFVAFMLAWHIATQGTGRSRRWTRNTPSSWA